MADVVEIDAATGTVIERDFTQEELAQRAIDLAESETRQAAEVVVTGNKTSIQDRMVAALQDNRDYLALASPTAAERNTQVERLTRQNNKIIRLMLNMLDGTD